MAAPTQTALAIITGALKLLNVKASGETLTASEGEDGLIALNGLADSWSNEPDMQPTVTSVSHTLVAGTSTYTIGASGTINTTWPVSLVHAHIRESNLDYEMEPMTETEFSNIFDKTIQSDYPRKIYYEKDYPLGILHLYPTPNKANTLLLKFDYAIGPFAALTTVINLPPGYIRALKYNLALEISPEYREASPMVHRIAQDSKNWIKSANSDQMPPARLPSAYVGQRGRWDSASGGVL